MNQTSVAQEAVEAGSAKGNRSWVYVVVILTIAYILNFVDRQVINILAEPIKHDLGLQDWELGVLTGLSFALVYGFMALPIARLAERTNRSKLIAAALTVWSGSTIACSFAQSFGQLAAARMAVAAGESGFTPASHSLITESVPKSRRTLAFGIFATGLPFGSMVAMAIGGLIADQWGWRAAFLFAGLPGILIALVVFFTVGDPRVARSAAPAAPSNFISDAAYLLGKTSFRRLILGQGLFAMAVYGAQAFMASFFFRMHSQHLDQLTGHIHETFGIELGQTAVLGPVLGIVLGLTGICSALLSGVLTDRLVARDVRYFSIVPGVPLLIGVPILITGLLSDNLLAALVLIALSACLTGLASPALASCIQSLASSNRRATASAISLLASVLFGSGLGPFVTGVASDLIRSAGYGSGEALQLALVATSVPTFVAGLLFLSIRKHLVRDLAAA